MRGNLFIAAIYLAGGLVLFLLGLVIFRENPRQRINRVTGTMMFFGALGPIFGAFGMLLQHLNPGRAVLQTSYYFNFFYLWEFFFPQLVLFSLIFPREYRLIRRHSRLWIWIFLPHLSHLLIVLAYSSPERILSFLNPHRLGDQLGPLVEPIISLFKIFTLLLGGIYQIHIKFFSSINLLYVIAAILLMTRGYLALRDPLQKNRARSVLWGLGCSVSLYAMAILLPILTPLDLPPLVRSTMVIVSLMLGTGSIAWAIVRGQFLDLRTFVRQSMVYSATTGLLVGAYLIVIRQLDSLVARALGLKIPYLDIAFVAIAVIFFQPLMSRMEELSERLFRRDRSDYRNVLQRLTQDIISIFEIGQLWEKIAVTFRAASLTERTSLLLGEGNRFCTYTSSQDPSEQIPFDRQGPTIQLMAKAQGPIAMGEIKGLLDDGERVKLEHLGAHLLVPIAHGEELLGVLCLGNKLGARRYNFEDMAMLSVFAGQMAIALVNSRLYQETLEKRRIEEELDRAREIQESLLPKSCPKGDAFLISALSKPSRWVGGDFYDFVTGRDGVLGIAIGDVSGKGMPAALLMAVLQASFSAQTQNHLSVRETVSRLNAHIAGITDAEKFVTFFYGELDLRSGNFTYSNAGHNFPLLIRAQGQIRELNKGGLVLGVMGDILYEEEAVPLKAGDTLVFYTDGITEAQNPVGEEFGEQRLVKLLVDNHGFSPQVILDVVLGQVKEFVEGAAQQDDSTIVVMQLRPSF